jgi:replication factor C large subunit
MLIKKYKPKNVREVVGQKEIIEKVNKWSENPEKPLLLHGPPGIGKTIIVEAIANNKNIKLLEINASDSRNASTLKEKLNYIKEGSLFKKRLVLIDEIDGLTREDRGGVSQIIKIINSSNIPIILTANNAYSPKLKPLRNYCELIKMNRIPSNLIYNRLKEICYKEKLKINDEVIRNISENSNGDLRSAINDLETKGLSTREREVDIFNVLKIIFKTQDLKTALKVLYDSDKNLDEIFWWVEQNVANEYEKPGEIAEAFELLSRADLFRAKIIKNQNYRFKKYMADMIAGIAMVKEKPYRKFVSYKYPDRIAILGRTKIQRGKENKKLEELGKHLHCSKRTVRNQLPYLNIILSSSSS